MSLLMRRFGVLRSANAQTALYSSSQTASSKSVIEDMKKAQDILAKSEVRAFCHRIGFQFNDQQLLSEALVHPSKDAQGANNSRLSFFGGKILNLLASEHVYAYYPNLPPRALNDALQVFTKTSELASIANNMGIKRVAQWTQNEGKTPLENGQAAALADTLQALIGAIYVDQGPKAAKLFVEKFVLSRTDVDLKKGLDSDRPKVQLYEFLKREGRAKPEYRILDESGRYTHQPTFAVGAYSGDKLLSKGVGRSVKAAEENAAHKYLLDHFLQSASPKSVPSDSL